MRGGTIAWIGLRPAKKAAMEVVTHAQLEVDAGLVGDCHDGGAGHHRQVTLFQMEHLPVVAALLGGRDVVPEMTRRNLGVSGINLLALEGKVFRIGDAVLQYTEPCFPCGRMNQTFGDGGLEAMLGHGGIMASVVQGGAIMIGSSITPQADVAG